jgi:hypothetical protein
MNTYKKTILASGIALLAFHACHATPEFDKLKVQLDKSFKALFNPPEPFVLGRFGRDAQAKTKLNNLHAALLHVAPFVKNNNKGLILGASTTLTQANEMLVDETTKLMTVLNEMRNRLAATNNFTGEGWDSVTNAQRFHVELVNIRDRIKPMRDTLRTKADDYKSTGQKEAYSLLVDALQDLHDGIEIVRGQLVIGGWLKK